MKFNQRSTIAAAFDCGVRLQPGRGLFHHHLHKKTDGIFLAGSARGEMILNAFGQIAHREWEKLSDRWGHVKLGAFQIMPNHMHGILIIHPPVGATARGRPH
ncbi:MAG: hypothetical protein IPJ40_03155 [Saprospirales bacterium]|nr:hypothetical protein [Saprospirales bacterium]